MTNTNTIKTITMKVTFSNLEFKEKPSGEIIKKINRDLKHVSEYTISEFAAEVAKGKTFTPAVFDGRRLNKNFSNQQLFALDFDSGISPKKAISILNEFGVQPNVYYPSFSNTEELNKFRLCIVLDEVVTDKKVRDNIQIGLMNIFESGVVDKACKDAARLFFGGKASEVISEIPNRIQSIIDVVGVSLLKAENGRFRRKVKEWVEDPQISQRYEGLGSQPKNQIVNYDFEKNAGYVKILDTFLKGEWLTHPQIFGLATSMIHITSGIETMKKTMLKYNKLGKTQYTENNFHALTYIAKMNYYPQKLRDYSPYEEDWTLDNLLTANFRHTRGHVEVLDAKTRVSLAEAEKQMKETFDSILNSKDFDIHLLKLPTGIGKTRLLEDLQGNYTVALPTNKLKDEVFGRIKTDDKTLTPTLPTDLNPSVQKRIDHYYKVGLHSMAMGVIIKEAKNDPKLADYLRKLRASYRASGIITTTHSRAMHSDFKSETLIFDEDPMNELLNIEQIKISDLIRIEAGNDLFDYNPSILGSLINDLRALPLATCRPAPVMSIDLEEIANRLEGLAIDSNIMGFFSSVYMIRDGKNGDLVHFIRKHKLPTDRKVVIMSATAQVDFYKMMYGDRVKVTDISNVEGVGEIIQYTKKSYSRHSLSTSKKIDIRNTKIPTITFQSFIKDIPNACEDMYFGNTSGYDSLNGKDLNVVGTPHVNNASYILLAMALGVEFVTSDLHMFVQEVEHNGFRFKFNTYRHRELRKIQMGLVEEQLLQAVGRARTLRKDSKVYVYSNYPLTNATKFINE